MTTGTRKSGRDVTSTALVSNNPTASTSSAVSIQPNKITTKAVPAFLNKLYLMVDDPKSDELIRWSDDGESFHVPLEQRFGKEMLPRYFKHSNFGSFVRQLNMYGFHKVPHIQQGVLHSEPEDASELLEFANANFIRGQPDLLHLIRRQKARTDAPLISEETALDLPTLLTDLSAIRKHQSALSADLKELQSSNNGLWQEAIQSRERHTKQQDTIDKILRFLATVFGGQVAGGESPGAGTNVVVEEEVTKESDGKGKGKETARTTQNRKTQLYLKDVPTRQNGTVEEEIEEIPQARHDNNLSTISNSSQYSGGLSPMTRTNSNSFSGYLPSTSKSPPSNSPSRFTTVPSPSPSVPTPPFVGDYPTLSPELLSSLLSSNNPDALSAFLQLQNPGNVASQIPNNNTIAPTSTGMTIPSMPAFDYTRALLPSPGPSVMPNDLVSMLSNSNAYGVDESFNQALMENNEVLQDVTLEKADIDQRTAALEEAINKLMNTLPTDTRERFENQTATGTALDLNNIGTSGVGGSEGSNWENTDDFLAHFVNNENNNVGQLGLDNTNSTFSPIDYSFLDPNLYGQIPTPINTNDSSNQFESVSPSDSALWKGQHSTSSERSSPEVSDQDEEEDEDDDGDYVEKGGSKKGKGKGKAKGKKKRNSDVLGGGGVGERKKVKG